MSADSRRGSGDETMSANVARNSPLSVSGKAIRSGGTWVGRLISRPVPRTEPPLALASYVNNATEGFLFKADGKILRGQ
jgi:hypothetical protein